MSEYQLFRAVRSQGTRHLVILSRKIWDDHKKVSVRKTHKCELVSQPKEPTNAARR